MKPHKRIAPVTHPLAGCRLARLSLAILIALGHIPALWADDQWVEFSDAFTSADGQVDISRFEKNNPVMPGTYRVDLYVNGYRIARKDIEFRAVEGQANASACFDYATLTQMNVDVLKLDQARVNPSNACIDLADVSPEATASMDMGELRLDVSIPQAALVKQARGYVSPELWDEGINAFKLGYNFNGYTAQQRNAGAAESRNSNAFLGLDMGLNLGGWRLRSQESASYDQQSGGTQWQRVTTTAEHDITAWKAQAVLGEKSTEGRLFNSTPFTGASIASDDRMYPDSLNGYAPVVRGMANTQARVEIRQNGMLLYETTVAPGPFEINDLYATGYGGDLEVTVYEADGTRREFSVPYAATPTLLRPGRSRWAVTTGRLRRDDLQETQPYFGEATYQRGINNWLTAYAGGQSTTDDLYRSALGGLAFNTPVGAVSLDITQSQANLYGGARESGHSTRLAYSRSFPEIGTDFALATFRYSSSGYLDLVDAASLDDLMRKAGTSNPDSVGYARSKQRQTLTLNQNLGERIGQLNITASRDRYWGEQPGSTTYSLGYNTRIKRASVGITASRTYNTDDVSGQSGYDSQITLNLSIPLGGPSVRHPATLSLNSTHDRQNGNSQNAGINGSLGETNQYTYGVQASRSDSRDGTGFVGNAGWQSRYANLGAGYSQSDDYRQASVSATGGLVAYSGGVVLMPSQDIGSPIGLVEAKGATGARLSSSGEARIDGNGQAVAAGLMPYRQNDVTLDPEGTSMDVELQTTRVQTVPRAGAVVKLTFETESGRAVLITARRPNGEELPFGAAALDEEGHEVGTVGQGGNIFVRGAEQGGRLTLSWGEGPGRQCHLDYSLPERQDGDSEQPFTTLEAECK
ncbi:fimbria/pilus outer membrane usher protein [Pseudomonas sp. CAN2814]|uniref:fimbria/pilus outer membrane usher protein n=1 Tax=Pseudomonas sp. CAN1 TaxID=3046726 RepID=UPI002648FC36|nr:fimbria/pilus outer membrane usher protein [Pseudomonas sp. CAN1]MDN6859913.1 fimbria/pilus outer membrane usher protein [Pseudomonas sp. CAN1]